MGDYARGVDTGVVIDVVLVEHRQGPARRFRTEDSGIHPEEDPVTGPGRRGVFRQMMKEKF